MNDHTNSQTPSTNGDAATPIDLFQPPGKVHRRTFWNRKLRFRILSFINDNYPLTWTLDDLTAVVGDASRSGVSSTMSQAYQAGCLTRLRVRPDGKKSVYAYGVRKKWDQVYDLCEQCSRYGEALQKQLADERAADRGEPLPDPSYPPATVPRAPLPVVIVEPNNEATWDVTCKSGFEYSIRLDDVIEVLDSLRNLASHFESSM